MAITIEDTPLTWAPVYNKVEYLLSSTNSGNTNFSYLVDVYINGSGTKTWRGRIPKRPSDDYCLVDIHRVLEASVTSDVGDTTSDAGINDVNNSSLTYIVKFGEEYDPGTGTITQYPDLTVDSSRNAVNASVEKQELIDWDFTGTYDLTGTSKKFITNMPDNHNVSINSHGWLYLKEKAALTVIEVQTYDSAGSNIASFQIDATAGTTQLQYIAAAPASLNKIDNTNLIAGTQPIIDSTVATYTIIAYQTLGATSETRNFTIKEPCKYNANTLIFQNKLGMFDNFTFYLGDSSTHNIERSDMKVNVDPVSGTSISYSIQEREKQSYYTKQSETIKLYSDWITEEEDAWLLELIESPEIYLQNGDDLIAVAKIKTTSHKKRKVVRDKLFKLEVEIELGYDNYRQRG